MGQSKEIKQKWKGYLISVSLQCLVTMSKVLLLEGKLGNDCLQTILRFP